MVSMRHVAAIMLLAGLCSSVHALNAASVDVCLLKFKVDSKQSSFTGSGTTTAPIPGKVSTSKLTATGDVWLRVPPTSSCPPNLTAENIDDLLQQSSLEVPLGSSSITFLPIDIASNVTGIDSKEPIAHMDFLGLGIGLTGTEPFGPGSVKVGEGAVADAKAAAQHVCSQLVMLNGTLDLSNKFLGPRTAAVSMVAMNRTLAAGLAVKKSGKGISNATLFLQNVTLYMPISPETKDGKGMPGVEHSTASYTLSGNVVAAADLTKESNWQQVSLDKVAWGAASRLDAPVVMGGAKPGKPRYIGVNSTIPQECKPTRVLDGVSVLVEGSKSAAQAAASSWQQRLLAAAAGLLGAALVL